MGGPAGFHHQMAWRLILENPAELLPIHLSPLDEAPLPVGDADFNDRH
jgi:hypothetical protein